MSDFARLEEKLSKLRQRERAPGEGRKLRGGGVEALMAGIVTEIDETILPRRLTFTLSNGSAVHLSVANRRLQAIMAPAPDGIDAAIVDQELPDADDPKVAALGVGLRAVLEGAESLAISSVRPKRLFASDVGVPIAQLERAWGIEVSEAEPADPSEVLGDFLKKITGDAIAWLRIEGEAVTDQGGDANAAAKLGENAAVFLDGYFSKFENAFPEPAISCGTVISPGPDHSAALFFIEFAELSAVISATPDNVLAIASSWQKLVAE